MLKETNDVLDLADAIAAALKAAKADGRVDWMDLPRFAPVIAKARAAIEGGDRVDDELKAAQPDELVAFAQRAIAVTLALADAVLAK